MNARRKKFVLEYLKDLNATQAAIRAGYSERGVRVTAHRLLADTNIQTAVQKAIKERERRTEITVDRVLEELAYIGFTKAEDCMTVDEGGEVRIKTFSEMSEAANRTIREVSERRTIKESSDGTQVVVDDRISYKLHDKLKALEMIGRHLAMWQENELKVKFPGGVRVNFVVSDDTDD